VWGVLVLIAACGRQLPTNRYDVLSGTVQSLRAETGQLIVHVAAPRPEFGKTTSIACLLGSDAEVYINDKFSALSAIQVGDAIELIGYRHPDPRTECFVVSLAYIARSEPLPPAPDLPAPSTSTAPTGGGGQAG
jgi:hypothetical protein